MAKKEKQAQQPSMKEQLKAQKRIDANISGAEVADEEETEEIIPEKMKVDELKAALDEAGVEYDSDAKKADLVKLYSDWLTDNQ